MMRYKISKLFSSISTAILIAITVVGCMFYPNQGNEIRMEIPRYDEGACIIEYSGYTVSYNEENRIPVWVAYELTRDETSGTITRSGKKFRPDERVSAVQADDNDYRNSGWSRGHMAPAGDFKWDEKAMLDTFYFTNCCPQDEKLNSGSWNVLENKVRTWAREFGSVFVVTGPIVGRNKNGKIGNHNVVVPDAFFKAVLVNADGGYHGIGFVMLNTSESQRLRDSYLSINELEKITGLDLFPHLSNPVEDVVDLKFWKIH